MNVDTGPEKTIHAIVTEYYPSVQAIYLFGSYRTADEWPDSDVDIGVLLPHGAAKNERSMAVSECRFKLEEALEKEVDLLNMRLLSTVFQFQIVRTGRLIYFGGQGDGRSVRDINYFALSEAE
ncbi:MAG: Nucleotidyltransferase domain protein [Syntrophorhabdaceae bacterium PtaU1.Bin034]|nr:MAG: Nucleotidyltransferase domain protein [Syntrophorhabdaceae bacterium PtaU1.Bin034]